jgi:hypothetical protein
VLTPDALVAERRNERMTGLVVAGTVLVLGWTAGFGHLLGTALGTAPSLDAAPPAAVPGTVPGTGSGLGPVGARPAPVTPPSGAGPTATTTAAAPVPSGPPAMPVQSPPVSTAPVIQGAPPAGSSGDACQQALAPGAASTLWMHLEKGHLEETPGQQVADVLRPDQYVKTHTALVESVLAPTVQALTEHGMDAASVFWAHVEHGHLEENPAQQVADVLDTDQYVKTHTVLVESMTTPYVSMVTGSC